MGHRGKGREKTGGGCSDVPQAQNQGQQHRKLEALEEASSAAFEGAWPC